MSRNDDMNSDNASSSLEYNMTHAKRGKCLLINMVKYQNNAHEERSWSRKDVELLKEVFQNTLGFEQVEACTDKRADDVKTLLTSQASLDHSDSDCFVCFVMGHGEDGQIIASDNEIIDVANLLDPIRKCKSLEGKPKLFFLLACQIDEKTNRNGQVASPEKEELSTPLNNMNVTNKNDADLLIYRTTQRGQLARGVISNKGSHFVRTLCQVLEKQGLHSSLSSMLAETNRIVFKSAKSAVSGPTNKEIFFRTKTKATIVKEIPILLIN